MDVILSGGRLESLRRDVSARKCPGAQPLRPPLTLALLRKVAQQEGATCYHVVEHAGILENQGLIQDQPSRLADRAPPSKEQRGVDGVGHERWVRDKDEVMTEQMAGTSRMISSPPRE